MDESASGGLFKRAIAWVILIAVGIVVLKLALGAVFGILQVVVSIALLAVVVMGALWALRQL